MSKVVTSRKTYSNRWFAWVSRTLARVVGVACALAGARRVVRLLLYAGFVVIPDETWWWATHAIGAGFWL